jgi:sugar lactone lactonase YvrE
MRRYLLMALSIVMVSMCHAQLITTVCGGNGYGGATDQLAYPYSICVDRSENIYVVDQNNNRVQKFPAGSTSATAGVTVAGGNGSGNEAFQLDAPTGIAIDSAGNIYVSDWGNNRVQEFLAGSTSQSNGLTVAGGNGPGYATFQLNAPEGLFIDKNNNLYIADADNNRIQMFPPGSTSGTGGITVAGGRGLGANAYQLSYPSGVYLDSSGSIYVADYLNNRIQKFPAGSDSTTNAVTVAGGNGMGDNSTQLNSPTDVKVDAAGNIFVADFYNNRTQKFPSNSDTTTSGVTVAGGNGLGDAADQLSDPSGIYVDSSGSIYIADYLNNRVQKWSASPAGINTIESNSISLYPNPNNGSFILNSTENIGKECSIYDMIARVVATQAITSNKQPIQLNALSAGSYILQIKGSSEKAISFVVSY